MHGALRNEFFRAAAGFLIASTIPAAYLAVIAPLDGEWTSVAGTFVVLYPFSLVATIVFGVPAFLLLRPLRPGRWWAVAAVGFLLGILVSTALRLDPDPYWVMGPPAAISTLVFWLIWKRSAAPRRDRTTPPR